MKLKIGLFGKIFFGYVLAVSVIVILSGIIIINAESFESSADSVNQDILPHTLDAKNLQIHVIQVQQWLTDISATRGAEGFDDGYDEAAEHAKEFKRIVAEFKSFYQQSGNKEKVGELDELQKNFDGFYEMGKKMAATYIAEGPESGNIFMGKFDPYAEEIYESVNAFVDAQSNLLVESIENIDKKSHGLIRTAFLLGSISFVVLLLIGFLLARVIVKPIKNFTSILREIADGDGDLTQRINLSSEDEIGEMASNFNKTFDKIRNLVVSVKNICDTLGSSASDLASNMTETAAAINEISANIKSIKNQTVNQSASVTETGSTMEQISGGIGKLDTLIKDQTSNIRESSASIDELIKSVNSVASTIAKNAENIRMLSLSSSEGKASLDKITSALRDVAKESEGLVEISQVISSIASQTNLLAMNAAIEAAHAGDTGKGFAVVADEVRKLAESSSAQTKTIEDVLKRIKDSIANIISFSEEVVGKFTVIENEVGVVASQENEIRRSVEEQSQESQRILDSIASLNDLTRKVQSSSVEMLEGSRQITDEARNMSSITAEISGGMNEMASGADQITKAVDKVNALSSENKNSIDSLIRELSRFKV